MGVNLQTSTSSFLKSNKYKVSSSHSGKIVSAFEKSEISSKLFEFLSLHSSCRAIFDGIVKTSAKSEVLIPDEILEELPDLFKESNTSFVFSVSCDCGTNLESPNICDYDFKTPSEEKFITCMKCRKKIKITSESYKPEFKPQIKDFYRILQKLAEYKIISEAPAIVCNYCDSFEELDPDIERKLRCPACKGILETVTAYIPDDEIDKLINKGNGNWLEWYIWRQLKNNGAECGLFVESESNEKFELDVSMLKEEALIIFECKDTNNDTDFLKKLYLINRIAEKFVLIPTLRQKTDTISTITSMLKEKALIIEPSQIEKYLKEYQ